MLELAIKARIPIIRARTTDLLNLPAVLEHIAHGVDGIEEVQAVPSRGGATLLYAVEEIEVTRQTFDSLMQTGRVLVLINQGEESRFVFDAGEVPVPKALMKNMLT